MEERKGRVSYVIGPDGSPLTLADLPPPSTRRWVIRRKAEVVAAVRGGLLSLDDACKRYTLTVEELKPRKSGGWRKPLVREVVNSRLSKTACRVKYVGLRL